MNTLLVLWLSLPLGFDPSFAACMTGPAAPEGMVPVCAVWDYDQDRDIDLRDFAIYQRDPTPEN